MLEGTLICIRLDRLIYIRGVRSELFSVSRTRDISSDTGNDTKNLGERSFISPISIQKH